MIAFALKKISFAKAIEISRPDHIFLIRGRDASGERAWYYVIIDKGKLDLFKAKIGTPFLRLTDYGQILNSGFGEEPSEEVKRFMEIEYGYRE